ncbi:S-protein homolog 5-like [Salvia miltiorrhiza]|uniref:S-protein homolog 5-like n=1 Tax=Salvia miltiorrhiza TaxID=226208 RepID=UPI0025AC1253|nr:S-protein homolog 5-like [Salvia miltiorrhiza]
MSGYTLTLIPFVVLVWIICGNHVQVTACITNRYEVHVTNKLPPKSAPLKLHCASKNDDLGNHILSLNQEIHWSFCDNFFWNTLFHCGASWGSKTCAFNAFNDHWNGRCDTGFCYWEVRADGFYMSKHNDDPTSFNKYADWSN